MGRRSRLAAQDDPATQDRRIGDDIRLHRCAADIAMGLGLQENLLEVEVKPESLGKHLFESDLNGTAPGVVNVQVGDRVVFASVEPSVMKAATEVDVAVAQQTSPSWLDESIEWDVVLEREDGGCIFRPPVLNAGVRSGAKEVGLRRNAARNGERPSFVDSVTDVEQEGRVVFENQTGSADCRAAQVHGRRLLEEHAAGTEPKEEPTGIKVEPTTDCFADPQR